MRKYLFILLILFSSCSSSVLLLETQSNDLTWEDEVYAYEDDFVRITYDLWGEHGDIVFTVLNKSDKPLYVDWSKSSFIKGQQSFKYWRDVSYASASFEGVSYDSWLFSNIDLKRIKGRVYTVESKPVKVSFIEPGTIVSRRFSPIEEDYAHDFDEDYYTEEKCNSMPSRKVKIYTETFDEANSPVKFRNFLTFAFDQSFSSEFSIDTEFYVGKVSKMPKRHFELFRPSLSDDISYPFQQSNSFFVILNK